MRHVCIPSRIKLWQDKKVFTEKELNEPLLHED
jgi:hypothetical protein